MNEDKGRKTLETRKDKEMKQNIGYEIDYIESKIIVSKKFLKEASNVTTTAYSELVKIRKDYPEFTIEPRQIAKRENKMTYGKLTYDFMRDYMAKFQNAQYVFVKKWFLGLYGDEFKREEDEEQESA